MFRICRIIIILKKKKQEITEMYLLSDQKKPVLRDFYSFFAKLPENSKNDVHILYRLCTIFDL